MLHGTKLLELFFLHPMDQQRSPCSLNFLAVTASYHSKVISIGSLLAEKIAKIVCFLSMYFILHFQHPFFDSQKTDRFVEHCI